GRSGRFASPCAGPVQTLALVGPDFSTSGRNRTVARRQARSNRSRFRVGGDGERSFYEGPVAEKIVASVRAAGGRMTVEDLKSYRAVERAPLHGSYRGYEIASVPPPSSGGVHIIELLNMLEGFPLASLGADSAATIHLLAEAMKLAYADRAEY